MKLLFIEHANSFLPGYAFLLINIQGIKCISIEAEQDFHLVLIPFDCPFVFQIGNGFFLLPLYN